MKSFLRVSTPGCKTHWDPQKPFHLLQWALGQCRHCPVGMTVQGTFREAVCLLLQVILSQSDSQEAFHEYHLRRSRSWLPLQTKAVIHLRFWTLLASRLNRTDSLFENLCTVQISAKSITSFLGGKKKSMTYFPLYPSSSGECNAAEYAGFCKRWKTESVIICGH